jgi:4-hydroxy-3-methylbut-2-enyl diphosphate reductase
VVLSTVEEVEALSPKDPDQLAYVTQTTLSLDDTRQVIDALNRRFPSISGPSLNDICYATQNRQNAVRALVGDVDLLLVVGSQNSSNSNRLRELGEREGVPSYLIDHQDEIQPDWVNGKRSIGVTAGASAPEILVKQIIDHLRKLGVETVQEVDGQAETVTFKNPPELDALAAESGR